MPVRLAFATAAGLVPAGLLVALAVSGRLALVVGAYAAVTIAYGLGLKGVPGLELALVASGFLLPALHLVASKRASELAAQPVGVPPQRVALRAFTPGGLSSLRWVTAAGMVFCYAGWAAVRPTVPDQVAAVPSLVAMVVVLLRWVVRTDGGRTQAPEGVLLHDPVVSVAALGARLRRIGVERALRGRPQIAYAPGPLRGVGPALLVPRALWRRLEL